MTDRLPSLSLLDHITKSNTICIDYEMLWEQKHNTNILQASYEMIYILNITILDLLQCYHCFS